MLALSRQSLASNTGSQKPRLVRQVACEERGPCDEPPTSPKLNVRFLPTIPSAPDSSVQLEEETENSKAVSDMTSTTNGPNNTL